MVRIYLIRHGKTHGNRFGRYIGKTEDRLCEEGIDNLSWTVYPRVEKLFVSPLTRCTQTADLIYPRVEQHVIDELQECNFGAFEDKSYLELADNREYQRWVDSGGTLPFPDGEDLDDFRKRCIDGFHKVVEDCIEDRITNAAIVAHGGTIMSIMNAYGDPDRGYFSWQVENGSGYEIIIEKQRWKRLGARKSIVLYKKLS
jgi:alpha-ribazole phosphatase